ncbi:MAG: DUF5659 domain-containing protein [Candidatus Berkelbacteria bacterium]|nr:DUF5659 domain-containing protein [Candidatus Berkelbacteria bacterium]
MKITNKQNYYKSSDLGCCAALVTAGFELKMIDKANPKRVVFIFDMSEGIQLSTEDYLSDRLEVSARRYFENLRVLKSRIYGD